MSAAIFGAQFPAAELAVSSPERRALMEEQCTRAAENMCRQHGAVPTGRTEAYWVPLAEPDGDVVEFLRVEVHCDRLDGEGDTS